MRLGFQVSISGKIYNSIEEIREVGGNCMQIFSRNPRRWETKRLIPEDIEKFKVLRKKYDIWPLAVHVPYLLNLSTDDLALFEKSIDSFKFDLKRAQLLEADYLVMHFGSHKHRGEEYGLRRLAEALNQTIKNTKSHTLILLENTAGAGTQLGYTFEHHAFIVNHLQYKERIGICLDTAHAFAAGFSLETKEGFEVFLDEIDKLIGLEKLKLVHLNDSFYPKGARIDRHQHLGKGFVGVEAFEHILKSKRLRSLPFILETPKKTIYDDIRNLNLARKLINRKQRLTETNEGK
jgi:deoxyribonuclease-4